MGDALTREEAQDGEDHKAGKDAGEHIDRDYEVGIALGLVPEVAEAGHVDQPAPAGSQAKEHLDGGIRPDLDVQQATPLGIQEVLDA